MKSITSVSNPYIKSLAELKKKSKKIEMNSFLVDGEDFIELAYKAKLLNVLLCEEFNPKYEDVEQIIVTKQILEKLSPNMSASSMIGLCSYPTKKTLNKKHYVYLDGVQDPGNVGTIIRTALAFNYDGVILSDDSASIYNDKVISATKGAIFLLDIITETTLKDAKENGFQIIGTGLKSSVDYKLVNLQDKFVVVLGNEGQGMKEENFVLCDSIVKIDMNNIDSLNVAIAGGILMNEYRRDF